MPILRPRLITKRADRLASSVYIREEEDSTGPTSGANFPIPAETLLEKLCSQLQLNPLTVAHLLLEGIEREGWRSIPEEKRLMEGRLTVLILSVLGHRWPRQIGR